jgi:hypothetical protein
MGVIQLKPGAGKSKGGQYEREICVKLSLWVSEGVSTELFGRSSGSGSHATYKKKQGKQANQTGDITAVDPTGTPLTSKYFVECKFYRDLRLDSLIYGTPKDNSVLDFWGKTKEDAQFFHKRPIIIMRQNNKKDLIGTDWVTYDQMKYCNYAIRPLSSYPHRLLHLFFLDEFLKIVDPIVFVNFGFESK